MKNGKIKKIISKLLKVFVFLSLSAPAFSQVFLNNGGNVNALQGSYIYVNGSVQNDASGQVIVDKSGGIPVEMRDLLF